MQFPGREGSFDGIQPSEGASVSESGRDPTLGSIQPKIERSENTWLAEAMFLRRLKDAEEFRNRKEITNGFKPLGGENPSPNW